MSHPYWPLLDLRIRTSRVELRIPDDPCLIELAQLAAKGVHPREYMPFVHPWTDRPPPKLEQALFQWHWRARAEWSPEQWRLSFVVIQQERVVGTQDLQAQDFSLLRTVETGSWLGIDYQGKGIGKEMRSAVLHLAFAGFDAQVARSSAFFDNEASLRVSRALDYVADGEELIARRGEATRQLRLRLDRVVWERERRNDIVVEGLEPCLPFVGAS